MDVGILGTAGSGKTTLYRALTGQQVEGYSDKAHVGMASIPDPRLERIAEFIETRKIIFATIQFVDIPGVPPGSDAKKLNGLLEQIRQVDAICLVSRCFDDGSGAIDPASDARNMESELILADLVVAENAVDRATRVAKSGDADAKKRLELLGKVVPMLEDEKAIRNGKWTDEEAKIILTYGFTTAKPVLYVANVSEDDPKGESEAVGKLQAYAETQGSTSVPVCANLEAEISEIDEADRSEMLESMGLEEPAIGPLARAANEILGLSTFYTAGEKEVRAWTIPIGCPAPQAAGAIHSDIERGFIRAECYHVEDLFSLNNEKAIKEAGKLRSEGKGYAMQDGDVVNFLFNV
ncbi:MAG: redox-regulated ATPase YchF [Phycisphaerales bacterium]|nr:redox-regulated ATPase YchF [Phycisphaerales bacterium]